MTSPAPYSLPVLPEELSGLSHLALDLRWSWSYQADALWSRVEPKLWALTRNPWLILATIGDVKLRELAADEQFRRELDRVLRYYLRDTTEPKWFQKTHSGSKLQTVAYFSMEYGLSEALPIYSGGLGMLAGDHLKTAHDLGVPLVAVGLLYQRGYFRQMFDHDGAQVELYPYNSPGELPVQPVRTPQGGWLRVEIQMPGRPLWLRAWEARVGRVRLLLLDTNDPENPPADRGITSELYGGGPAARIAQELILGIGGWRLLRALDIQPEVCHLNEGHAAFAVLERARWFMQEAGRTFGEALAVTRAGNLFTTHTAVAAGFDRFEPQLVTRFLGSYAERLGIGADGLLALGRADPSNRNELFNMAWLAIRGSGAVNGVSRLHGAVSRRLFASLFPGWPEAEVPVGSVTNGVHVPSWDSEHADAIWTKACGQGRWVGDLEGVDRCFRKSSDEALWEFRNRNREELIRRVRERLGRQVAASGFSPEEIVEARRVFDPHVLTVGFARRFATYKRPNLLLYDKPRLMRLLTDPQRPIQLIIAGKAHPADQPGRAMVQEWIQFLRHPQLRHRAVFIADYDMVVAEMLIHGVDLWINNPRRPWEASGTSGMKVLVNGGLNLSELDGWWAEAYSPEVGWALGDGQEHGEDPAWDWEECQQLFRLLEEQIIPDFYDRDERGVPVRWTTKMRESMARLTPAFSTNRMLREYTDRFYLPLAERYCARAEDRGQVGTYIRNWMTATEQGWSSLRFGQAWIHSDGQKLRFDVEVGFGRFSPDAIRVELYADGLDGAPPVTVPMQGVRALDGGTNFYLYTVEVPADRPASHFTPRMVPRQNEAAVPLECPLILWQR